MTLSTCGGARTRVPSGDSSIRCFIRRTSRRSPGPRCDSARANQIRGTVTGVHHGEVMSTIKATLGDGQPLTAAITKDAAKELDLVPGDAVLVIVKSTEVMVAKVN